MGDDNDIVTIEMDSAIRQKVPIILVLIDGTEFPKEEGLHQKLKHILHINALEIRHTDFDHGVSRLAGPIYGFLGLKPPTSLEHFMESLMPKIYFRGYRYDERQRALHAFIGLFISLLLTLGSVALVAEYLASGKVSLEDALPLFLAGVLTRHF